ncbi:glycosyltransferase family 4 protein [Halobacterium salinarum]|uniref:glycosyltransferase family 4 protein n=1 Tax=Halobacterium salinarum TaxID=2242 RepID=UPI002552B008|nr:glycosyltransferase family 4 protein [Halobacterium salinarum]MDL0138936.1 glycosyltransferase family 4 protein [Halobacterium salinarum]
MDRTIYFISPKIREFLSEDPGSAGGAERQQYLLANELRKFGFNIGFITASGNDQLRSDGKFEVWESCPVKAGFSISFVVEFLKFLHSLYVTDADYYYVRGLPRIAVVTNLVLSLLNRSLVYCIANESNINQKYLYSHYSKPFLWAYFWMLSSATIVSQTESQAKSLREDYGVDSVTIPNGCEITPEVEFESSSKSLHVLWVGRIQREQKRPDRLLDIAEELPDVSFELIGPLDGEDAYCDRIVSRANSLENVVYSGFVDPDDIYSKYVEADLLLNTSDYEGFPNTFLEAWQSKALVVSMYYSFDNKLKKFKFGHQAPGIKKTKEEIAKLANKNLSESKGRAREYVINNYSISNIANEYAELFTQSSDKWT